MKLLLSSFEERALETDWGVVVDGFGHLPEFGFVAKLVGLHLSLGQDSRRLWDGTVHLF